MRELILSLVSAVVARMRGKYSSPYFRSRLETWPWGHERGELAISQFCNAQESKPCTFPGQQGRGWPWLPELLVSWSQGHESRRDGRLISSDTFQGRLDQGF